MTARVICLALALCQPLAPAYGHVADPPEDAGSANTGASQDMDDVWDAIREGSAHVEVARYGDAIAAYERALPRLAEAPEWASQANLVRKLLSEAYLGRYRVSKATPDLARARELMAKHLEELPQGSSDRPEAEERLAELDGMLEAAQASRPTDRVEWKELSAVTNERNARAKALVDAENRKVRTRLRRTSTALLVLGGVGIVASAVLTPLAFSRQRKGDKQVLAGDAAFDATYDQADRLATAGLASGIVGGVAAVSGVIFLLRASHVERKRQQLSFVPTSSGATIWFSSRF